MALGRHKLWAAITAVAFGAAALLAAGQSSQTPQAPTPQQQQVPQQVPDAPAPQTVPNLKLNTITPVAPAVPGAAPSSASPDASASGNGGATPGTSLPSTPAPTAQTEDEGPPPASHASDIRVYTSFVQVPFTVKDSKNHLVAGLTWRDTRVYENGVLQQIRLFTSDPFPLSVALVIDQSVTFDTMEKINASLGALQGAFSASDEIAVFTYNNGVTKQTDFTAAQSARLGVILERSKGSGREPLQMMGGPLSTTNEKNNLNVDPNTSPSHNGGGSFQTVPKEIHTLNDAIFAAAQETVKAPRERRRIVYVISDGKEYGSKVSEKQLIKYLQTNKVEVYATLVGDSSIPGLGFLDRIHLPLTMRDDELPRITAATGGQCDPEFRPRGIEASFAKITDEVRSQYTVGYYTHASPFDERFRRLDVRILRPSLTIVAPDGYYPTASDSHPSKPTDVVPSATP
jgi:VWFA-related protein